MASIAYEGGSWGLLSGVASLGGDANELPGDPFYQDARHIGLYSCRVNYSSSYTVDAGKRTIKIIMVVTWSK